MGRERDRRKNEGFTLTLVARNVTRAVLYIRVCNISWCTGEFLYGYTRWGRGYRRSILWAILRRWGICSLYTATVYVKAVSVQYSMSVYDGGRHNVSGLYYILFVIEDLVRPFDPGRGDIGNVASYEFPSYTANFTTQFGAVNSVSRATRTSAM